MAQLIQGDREVFSQVLFGAPSYEAQQYFTQTQQSFLGSLTNMGRQFIDTAQQTFARIDTSEAMQLARTALRHAQVYLQDDTVIYHITEVADIQAAPTAMIPYIMQHDIIRKFYQANEIDAYGNRYHDPLPHHSGWGHIHYDLLYSGQVNETVDEDGETYLEYTETFLTDEERAMLPEDDRDIMLAVLDDVVNKAIAEGRDPTSIYDGQLPPLSKEP